MVMSPVPSKEAEPLRSPPSPIDLAVSNAVAVSALPEKLPLNDVAVIAPDTLTSPPTVSLASVAVVPIPTSALSAPAMPI